MLINIYNANNEPKNQLKFLTDFGKKFYCVGDIQNKNIIFGGDFNIMSYYFLKCNWGHQV